MRVEVPTDRKRNQMEPVTGTYEINNLIVVSVSETR
jgi:hypothetical protein